MPEAQQQQRPGIYAHQHNKYPSYSRRHASFNSPREVPLPSPNLDRAESANPFSFLTTASYNLNTPSSSKAQDVFDSRPSSPSQSQQPRSPTWSSYFPNALPAENATSHPPPRSRTPSSPLYGPHNQDDTMSSSWRQRQQQSQHISPGSSSATPTPLGYSSFLPQSNWENNARSNMPSQNDSGNHSNVPPRSGNGVSATDLSPIYPFARPYSLQDAQSNSYSSALSTYLHTPSNPIPAFADLALKSTSWLDRYSSASLPLPSQIPYYALPRVNPVLSDPVLPSSRMSSSASEADLDNTKISSLSRPPPPSSSSSTEVASLGPGTSTDRAGLRRPPVKESASSSSNSSSSSSSVNSAASTGSSPTTENSCPSPNPLSSNNSLRKTSHDDSSNNVLPRNDSQPSRPASRPISPFRAPQPPAQTSRAPVAQPTAMRQHMTLLQSAYPPPEPPVILPTEPTTPATQASIRNQPPYVPFLSHEPPPTDSWIEVETLQNEYKLHVRLPGFSREGITLATKRRRILHVVADSWENGGGHFERRISFGYDADLLQVRAEFDGVMLRISIPRRISPITWSS